MMMMINNLLVIDYLWWLGHNDCFVTFCRIWSLFVECGGLTTMIVLSLFVEFDKIDATKSSFCRFLSKLTKTLLYGSTWQKVGAVFVTFCRFLSIFVTNFPSDKLHEYLRTNRMKTLIPGEHK